MAYIKVFYAYRNEDLEDMMNEFLERIDNDEDIIEVRVSLAATRDQTQERDYHHYVGTILYKGNIVEEP